MIMSSEDYATVTALIVHQWLEMWDRVKFSTEERRRKPEPYFYIFTMPADMLRRLSDIYRRQTDRPRAQDYAIQRRHDPQRSAEIRKFIRGGFPWSDLSDRQQQSAEYRDLQMPGWLPTAIIANILAPNTKRGKSIISDSDVIKIEQLSGSTAKLQLPRGADSLTWNPVVAPIEIIDGQHRLLAFEGDRPPEGDYELPVVAFYDLDITWQAYLFYMINIKPKRIDPSLAFDLYPILRIQDWLEKTPETAKIYRETRAQELTEILWSHSASPWRNRISMLGERKKGTVTQSAFIRSLMSSYVRRGRGPIGGLFGSRVFTDADDVLSWDRVQQAAFLILVWQSIAQAVTNCEEEWARHLRDFPSQEMISFDDSIPLDHAFTSGYSLLTTDQGARGILQVTNDMCFVAADQLGLAQWDWAGDMGRGTVDEAPVTEALASLDGQPVASFLTRISNELMKFDWRTSSTPELEPDTRRAQMIFKGSSGYRELRRQLVELLAQAEDSELRTIAVKVSRGFED